jgi:hypothetical protein
MCSCHARHFLWLHEHGRGGNSGRPLFDATVMNYYFTAQLQTWIHFGKLWQWQRHKRPMQIKWIWPGGLMRLCLFDIDAWTVLQNLARSKDVFGRFWQWRQWSFEQKGLDTWTKVFRVDCTDRQWRRVKRENTKKNVTPSSGRVWAGGTPLHSYNSLSNLVARYVRHGTLNQV